MTDSYNSIEALDAAIMRTRRIAANISDPEDTRLLDRYIIDLQQKKEGLERVASDE
jgi:hypothetical protein